MTSPSPSLVIPPVVPESVLKDLKSTMSRRPKVSKM
jgi:hypothetical protein